MPLTDEQVALAVDGAAAAIGLHLDAAHRPGVLRYYALAASMAELVMDGPLGLADEPAPVFVPVSPRSGTALASSEPAA